MGIAERREREREKRYNDIIDAAERIFFSRGHLEATMDDVADEAELSKGTLYLYFRNKEELYLAIHHRGLSILSAMFQEAASKQVSGLQKVRAIGEAYYQFSCQHPDYFNALIYYESHEMDFSGPNSVAMACDKKGQEVLMILIGVIQNGIKDQSIRPDIDPVRTAIFLWGSTSGLFQLVSLKGDHLRKNHGMKLDEMIPYTFDLIGHSLTGTGR